MIGDRLKELRTNSKIYQADLAEVLGVSKGAVAMWETNKREPDSLMLKKIANYFNVSLDYLLDNEQKPTAPASSKKDDLKFALFNSSDGITDEMFDEVKQFAEMVKLREEQKLRDRIKQSKNDEEIEVFVAARSEGNKEMPKTERMSKSEWERLKNLPETDDDF